jgi:6-phosphofructokinase 1
MLRELVGAGYDITPEDYEAAKAYVANPEAYDFKKILNW